MKRFFNTSGMTYKELNLKEKMEEMKSSTKPIRWNVFIPCFVVIGGAAILGIVNNEWLTTGTKAVFTWSLSNFG